MRYGQKEFWDDIPDDCKKAIGELRRMKALVAVRGILKQISQMYGGLFFTRLICGQKASLELSLGIRIIPAV